MEQYLCKRNVSFQYKITKWYRLQAYTFPDVTLLSYLNLLNYSRNIFRGFPCILCSHVLIVENIIQGVLSSAPALASKKRGAANAVTRRKSESASTNKKTVTNSNSVTSVPKQPRQRRESSKDKSQTAPSLATATQRRSSMGQSRKKETLRSATENKRATARRKVCSECDGKGDCFVIIPVSVKRVLCFSIPLNVPCLTRVCYNKFT